VTPHAAIVRHREGRENEETDILDANAARVPETLAELVRGFRSATRLSQEALAEGAGLSTRTISDIETGFAKTPRLVTVMLLAEALRLTDADRQRLQDAARKPAPRAPAGSGPRAAALRPIALIGRDAQVEELSALIERDDVRLVTLCGPAGVGKTSLAVRVAADCAAHFADGVALIELAPLVDPALVPSAIAQALDARETADAPAREAVLTSLAKREMLIVLDNLEHLLPVAAWLGELIEACPRVTLLVMSREPLRLRTEHVYATKPLDASAAAALFVRRAQAVQPGFALTSANDAAIASIVQRLEGLPLAIELAAPRLRVLPPKALAARLDRRLPLLGEGAIDLPERQQTMRSAIAWSYDLLGAEEQRLFRRLAVLQGGGTLDAARAVAEDEPSPNQPFLLRIAALVEKSLLSLEEDAEGEPRVTMLEMLREYAAEQLGESGEAGDVRRRHAAWLLTFVQRAELELSRADQGRWVARFEREHPNVRAALQWASDERDAAFGLDLAIGMWRFWWSRGYMTEGAAWLRRFVELIPSSVTPVPTKAHARALRAQVVLTSALGHFDDAETPCKTAIRLQREIGDDAGLGASLTSLGIILQFRGDLEQAEVVHEESLTIRRRIGDEVGIANSLSNLASVTFSRGDMQRAGVLAEESAERYRRLGHISGTTHALIKLGLVATQERQFDRAERLFEECLELQHSVGNTGAMFYPLTNLGSVAFKRGDFSLALERLRAALDLLDAVPNKAAIASTLECLASTLVAVGETRRAARIFGAAEALRATIGSPRFPAERDEYEAGIAAARAALGDVAFDTERQIGASMTLERSLDEARAPATEVAR